MFKKSTFITYQQSVVCAHLTSPVAQKCKIRALEPKVCAVRLPSAWPTQSGWRVLKILKWQDIKSSVLPEPSPGRHSGRRRLQSGTRLPEAQRHTSGRQRGAALSLRPGCISSWFRDLWTKEMGCVLPHRNTGYSDRGHCNGIPLSPGDSSEIWVGSAWGEFPTRP